MSDTYALFTAVRPGIIYGGEVLGSYFGAISDKLFRAVMGGSALAAPTDGAVSDSVSTDRPAGAVSDVAMLEIFCKH